jgi:hypothetical protein
MAIGNILLKFNFYPECESVATSSYTTGASSAGVSVGEGCSGLFPFKRLVATWLCEDSTPAMIKNSNHARHPEGRRTQRADCSSKNYLPWLLHESTFFLPSDVHVSIIMVHVM